MTKILVVSDSHGNKEQLKKLIDTCTYDYMFFLGDVLSDLQGLNIKNLVKVKGNWDADFATKRKEIIQIENVKIMLVHGHGYNVKMGLNKLLETAKKEKIKLVCYGHTHIANFTEIDGIGFVNPGAFSGFKKGKFTYATVQIDGDKIYVNMWNYLN